MYSLYLSRSLSLLSLSLSLSLSFSCYCSVCVCKCSLNHSLLPKYCLDHTFYFTSNIRPHTCKLFFRLPLSASLSLSLSLSLILSRLLSLPPSFLTSCSLLPRFLSPVRPLSLSCPCGMFSHPVYFSRRH